MDEDWERIYYTWLGWGHISLGAGVLTLGFIQANGNRWPFPAIVCSGFFISAGIYYLYRVRRFRDPPPEAPAPFANGHARVGIPLAPAERNDPELAIEGLLLNHPPPPPEDPVLHPNGRVSIPLVPAGRDDPEPAIEGLLLNHPPPEAPVLYPNFRVGIPLALAERDDPELAIGGLILDYGLPLIGGELRNLVVFHNPPAAVDAHGRVGIQIAPAEQDDPELAMVGHVHDPPQVLNWREGDGVEEEAGNEARLIQVPEGNEAVRVGHHPAPVEQGCTEFAMLRHQLLNQPIALDRRESSGVEGVCNDTVQLQVTRASDAVQSEIRLKPTEVLDPSIGVPLQAEPLGDPLQTEPFGDPLQTVGDPLQTEPLGDPLQAEPLGDPLQAEPLGEPLQAEPLGDPLQAEPLGDPLQAACAEHTVLLSYLSLD